jgi:DNA polymerase III delta subunit
MPRIRRASPVIHVVLGPDRLLAQRTAERLVLAADPTGNNVDRFDAASHPIQDVIDALATPSFFAETRVIVATGYLRAGHSSGRRTSRSTKSTRARTSQQSDPIDRLFSAAVDESILLLVEPDAAKVTAEVQKRLPETAEIHAHAPRRGRALIDLVVSSFQRRGNEIDTDAARLLLDRMFPGSWQQAESNPDFDRPPDMESLLAEIEKLSTAAAGARIDEDLIESLTPQALGESTFPFLDAILTGSTQQALRELDGTPPTLDERSRLLAQLQQQIEIAAAAVQDGRPGNAQQSGRDLRLANPGRLQRIDRTLAGSAADPVALARAAVELDRRLKRGQDVGPNQALYGLIEASAGTKQR